MNKFIDIVGRYCLMTICLFIVLEIDARYGSYWSGFATPFAISFSGYLFLQEFIGNK